MNCTVLTRKIATAFIYTMNILEEVMKEFQYPVHLGMNARHLVGAPSHVPGSRHTGHPTVTRQEEDSS